MHLLIVSEHVKTIKKIQTHFPPQSMYKQHQNIDARYKCQLHLSYNLFEHKKLTLIELSLFLVAVFLTIFLLITLESVRNNECTLIFSISIEQ